jgi:esterase FrsA
MPALLEAKQFVALHAVHMGLRPPFLDRVLQRIVSLGGEEPGSWVNEWSAEAEAALRSRDERTAANLYNLARFPVADSQAKTHAARSCADALGRWLKTNRAGERRVAVVNGHEVAFLFNAPKRPDAPLVVLIGGIVSLKEQWSSFLTLGPRLGCAVAIADFPGVGENHIPYSRDAAAVFGTIMNATRHDCDVRRTLIVAPSFGGHLAILYAQADRRIRGIVTVGAPLTQFFTDTNVRSAMPEITRSALQHVSGVEADALDNHLTALALRPSELSRLHAPVTYIASLRDEIIPQSDWGEATRVSPKLRVYAFNDVHGAPHHLRETWLLILSTLLRHAGRKRLGRLVEQFFRMKARLGSTHPQSA